MSINLIEDILKHDDDETIAYLSSSMLGVAKNYKAALDSGHPEVLWANYGDIVMVSGILKALKQRNDLRKTPEV